MDSPSRSGMGKRKMPDTATFYPSPALKTQLFTSGIGSPSSSSSSPNVAAAINNNDMAPRSPLPQRLIHHQHTNSLPVEAPMITMMMSSQLQQQQSQPQHGHFNVSNQYQASYQYQYPNNCHQASQQPASSYTALMPSKQTDMFTQPQHVKTYSLPVSFDNGLAPNGSMSAAGSGILPPPSRTYNSNGDIPLPPGWEFQQTQNGQFYYINQMTKTTTWEDPRKTIYNLPSNQCDISADLRAHIKATISLPTGWEEAMTPQGERYYINHNSRTTSWEDPRLNIYMQQEQIKYQRHQMFSTTTASTTTSYAVSNSSSSSSLNSVSVISNSSSSSSVQSLSVASSSSANQKIDDALVASLKKSLNDVINQKTLIRKQIEEISKQEMLLKSKLSPKDLEEIAQRIKSNENKTNSSKIESKTDKTPTQKQQLVTKTSENNNSAADNSNSELDSTFIADSSSNNLNISTS